MAMKNRSSSCFNKISNNHIKGIMDKNKHIVNQVLCEQAINELKKIYWYEKELLIAIPMLIESATTFELVESLNLLNLYTKNHIKVVEKKFPKINKIELKNKLI